MSKTITYKCDICREEVKKKNLYGAYFTGMTKFRLSGPETTDGVHICIRCLEQIFNQCTESEDLISFEWSE